MKPWRAADVWPSERDYDAEQRALDARGERDTWAPNGQLMGFWCAGCQRNVPANSGWVCPSGEPHSLSGAPMLWTTQCYAWHHGIGKWKTKPEPPGMSYWYADISRAERFPTVPTWWEWHVSRKHAQ